MFKVNLNQFDQATQSIHNIHQNVNVSAERTAAVNVQFMSLMMGVWADAENAACVNLESNLRVFREALSQMASTYDAAGQEMRGTLSDKRQAVYDKCGGGAFDKNLLQRNDSIFPGNDVSFTLTSYETLKTGIRDAIDSMSRLNDAGTVVAALNSLTSKCDTQKTTVTDIGTAYQNYTTAVDTFENTYSGKLAADKFITDKMVETASKGMQASYSHTPLSQVSGFLSGIKSSSAFKNFKKWGNAAAKVLDQWEKGVDNMGAVMDGLTGVKKAFIGALQNYDCTGDVVYALKTGGKEMVSSLGSSLKTVWKSLGGWDKFVTKFKEGTGLFRPSQWDAVGKGIFGGTVDKKTGQTMGNLVDEFENMKNSNWSNVNHNISRFGDGAKKFFRGVGFVADAVDVVGYVSDTNKAYYTHSGDMFEKAGAAAVQVGESVAKFGVGKLIGAGIGFVCGGGPVGAVAGAMLGSWIDEKFIKPAWEGFDKSGQKEGMIDGVGDFFRNTFGGGKKSAFAPGK